MPTKTWVVGEEVLAADFNTYVQRQVVATFSNAAARDAAIPSPAEGMVCYVSDIDQLQVYTDRTTPNSWRRPWSQPWGRVLHQATTDVVFSASVNVPNSGFTFPVQNRRYLVTFMTNVVKFNDTVGTLTITITRDGTTHYLASQLSLQPNFRSRLHMQTLVTADAANSGGVVSCSCDSGQGQFITGVLALDDVGP